MAEYLLYLTPLTPIHIGNGALIEPLEYVIFDRKVHHFTLNDLLLALPKEAQAQLVARTAESIPATRTFVIDHAEAAQGVARWQADIAAAAHDLYQARLAGGEGHPEIRAQIRTRDRLYLPASSLKGAVRTALLYDTMDKPSPERKARDLEQRTFQFRRVQEDPFRAVKLADGAPLDIPGNVRAVAVNTHRHGNWAQDVALLVETIPGWLSDKANATSTHAVRFDEDFFRLHQAAFSLTPGQVLVACRNFYGQHLQMEQQFTRALPETATIYQALDNYAGQLPANAALIRLGWGSGLDATTVNQGLVSPQETTSRRLTADGVPLGWAALEITHPDGSPVEAEPVTQQQATRSDPVPAQQPRRIQDLQPGMILTGRVSRLERYGAFVDLGIGRDGLIHISQLAEGFVNRVEDVVKMGDEVQVEVLDVDLAKRRIGLKLLGWS